MSRKLVNFRLPSDLVEAIEVRAQEKGISKTELVEAFIWQGLGLSVKQDSFTVKQDINQLVKQSVNEAIAPLENRIQSLEKQVGRKSTTSRQTQLAPRLVETKPAGAIAPDSTDGLSQTDLCRAFNIDPSNVSKRAKKIGMNAEDYLNQQTGWTKRGRLWYPQ